MESREKEGGGKGEGEMRSTPKAQALVMVGLTRLSFQELLEKLR